MHNYRLVVRQDNDRTANEISVNLESREEALIVAQRFVGPAELWDGDVKLCVIDRLSDVGPWIISPAPEPTYFDAS